MGAAFLLMTASLLGAEDITLVQFTADWCPYCRNVKPTVERLERDGYPVVRIDVDANKDLVRKHRVRALPTFLVMRGDQELKRREGESSYNQLLQMFEASGVHSPTALGRTADQSAAQGLLGQALQSITGSASAAENPRTAADAPRQGRPPTAYEANAATPAGAIRTASSSRKGPEIDSAAARDRAMQASVKLRVEDATGYSFGAGSIIDTHGSDALVLTCGHIFRESRGQGLIEVEIYTPSGPKKVVGELIAYEPDYRDIGLVAIRPGFPVTAAPLAQPNTFRPDDRVFSIGCDRGRPPSLREGRITSLNRFQGSPNIEVSGKPVVGRSGGGLFNHAGELIGVCKLANPTDDEGIYASIESVHFHLDKAGLSSVYRSKLRDVRAEGEASLTAAVLREDSPVPSSPAVDHSQPSRASRGTAAVTPVGSVRNAEIAVRPASYSGSGVGSNAKREVIVVIRPQDRRDSDSEVLLLDEASDELIQAIRQAVERSRKRASGSSRPETALEQTTDRRNR